MHAAQSETLERLMRWYSDQCDGKWEHVYGIGVRTLDNPGWSVRIKTTGTATPLADLEWRRSDPDTATDWLHFRVEGGTFEAAGDPKKLDAMLRLFLDLVEGSH